MPKPKYVAKLFLINLTKFFDVRTNLKGIILFAQYKKPYKAYINIDTEYETARILILGLLTSIK